MNAQGIPIIEACTAEIRIHLCIFIIIIFPIVVLILPSVLLAFSVHFLVYIGVEFFGIIENAENITNQVVDENFTKICCLFFVATSLLLLSTIKDSIKIESTNRPLREPKGIKGGVLINTVDSLWKDLGVSERPSPNVVWFVNFNLLAHAVEKNKRQEIQVSSGLWEKIAQEDSIANVILTHEIAHLVHRDPLVFRFLNACINGAQKNIKHILNVCIFSAILVLIQQLSEDIAKSISMLNIVRHSIAIIATASLVLAILPLGEIIVRRYIGFMSSLMEVRADVSAGLWTEGLDQFVSSLKNEPLRRLTLKDLIHSLFSLDMTHISDIERLTILKSSDRLITPKIRYFVLSLSLAFFFPLNSVTPWLASGAIDHLIMLTTVVAFHAAGISMIILSAEAVLISWSRSFILAMALCASEALPNINFGEVGYMLTNLAISLGNSLGFGSEPVSYDRITQDFSVTMNGFISDIKESLHFGWFIISVAVATFALHHLSLVSKKLYAKNTSLKYQKLFIAVGIACFMAIISGYDPWRNYFFEIWPLCLAENWFLWTEAFPWVRLCSPSLSSFLMLYVFLKCSSYYIANPKPSID